MDICCLVLVSEFENVGFWSRVETEALVDVSSMWLSRWASMRVKHSFVLVSTSFCHTSSPVLSPSGRSRLRMLLSLVHSCRISTSLYRYSFNTFLLPRSSIWCMILITNLVCRAYSLVLNLFRVSGLSSSSSLLSLRVAIKRFGFVVGSYCVDINCIVG
jgi:hypothetical protein